MTTPVRMDGFATIVESEFEARSTELMKKDLAKSGLDETDVFATPLKHPPVPMNNPQWVLGAYRIPYFDREGNMLVHMYRDRLFYRPHVNESALKEAGMGKYKGPSLEQAALQGVDARMPYLLPGGKGTVGIICEGEKKAAAALNRFGCKVLGIGGCWNWSDGDDRRLHEDIIWWAGHLKTLYVVSDPDINTNDQVKRGYSGLYIRLQARFPEATVKLISLEDKIDEYLEENEDYGLEDLAREDEVEDIDISLSLRDMAQEYDLHVKTAANGTLSLWKNAYNVSQVLSKHPRWAGEIKYNEDDLIVELYKQPIIDKYNDHQICAVLNRHLHLPDLSVKMVREAIDAVARHNSYSPARVDIEKCGEWDGVERLKDIFGEGRSANEVEMCKAFVVGYVKRVMEPGCDWRVMTILVGRQGVGKTGMARWLAGDKRRVAIFHPANLKSMNKDVNIRLMKSRIALFDDIDTFGHSERGQLKAIITQTHTVDRVAYGHFDQTFLRGGIMMGTANDEKIIPDDPTGNTRFAVLKLDQMQDWTWLNENRAQIIAEARALVVKGWIPQIDWKVVTDAHTEKSHVQEKLEEFIEGLRSGEKDVAWCLIEGRKGKYFKSEAFWRWAFGENYKPKDWERKDFGQRARAMGLVHGGESSVDRTKDGRTLKKVWKL